MVAGEDEALSATGVSAAVPLCSAHLSLQPQPGGSIYSNRGYRCWRALSHVRPGLMFSTIAASIHLLCYVVWYFTVQGHFLRNFEPRRIGYICLKISSQGWESIHYFPCSQQCWPAHGLLMAGMPTLPAAVGLFLLLNSAGVAGSIASSLNHSSLVFALRTWGKF